MRPVDPVFDGCSSARRCETRSEDAAGRPIYVNGAVKLLGLYLVRNRSDFRIARPPLRGRDGIGRSRRFQTGTVEMATEQIQIPAVGLPAEVEQVADNRDRAERKIDPDIGGHAAENRRRNAETARLEDDVSRKDRRRRVADAGNKTEKPVETEAPARSRQGEAVIEQMREPRDPPVRRLARFVVPWADAVAPGTARRGSLRDWPHRFAITQMAWTIPGI